MIVNSNPVFSPIPLRAAKTLWSFGRSECNMVKVKVQLHFECNRVKGDVL